MKNKQTSKEGAKIKIEKIKIVFEEKEDDLKKHNHKVKK